MQFSISIRATSSCAPEKKHKCSIKHKSWNNGLRSLQLTQKYSSTEIKFLAIKKAWRFSLRNLLLFFDNNSLFQILMCFHIFCFRDIRRSLQHCFAQSSREIFSTNIIKTRVLNVINSVVRQFILVKINVMWSIFEHEYRAKEIERDSARYVA